MHDFWLTFPYGLLVLIGGVVAYFRRGSTASLAAGVAAGGILLLAGFLSLRAFENQRSSSYAALSLETLIAIALTFIMGRRYLETSKIMPAGFVAFLSALMSIFYIYKVATVGNHVAAKVAVV